MAGFAGSSLLLVVFTPLLVHRMGVSEYGLWAISLAAFGLIGALDLGLGTALSKYVSEYVSRGDAGALSEVVGTALAFYAALALALGAPLFLGAHLFARLFAGSGVPVSQVESVLRLTALGLLPLLLKSAGLALAVGLQRFEVPMAASLVQNVLTVGAALAVTALGGSVEAVVLSSLCVLVAVAVASLAAGLRAIARHGAKPVVARAHVRRLSSYLAFTSATSIGSLMFDSLDRIAVGATLGVRAVTYYSVSVSVANKIHYVADVAARPLMPAASRWLARGEDAVARAVLVRATMRVAAGSLVAAAVAVAASEPLLRLWMGRDFTDHALDAFRILVVVYALTAICAPAYHVANGIGLPWVNAAAALAGGASSVALIVVLSRPWGLIGAAWANAAYWIMFATPAVLLRTLRQRDNQTASGEAGWDERHAVVLGTPRARTRRPWW
ncbi:MAG TPA: oligosaccharide flippase family protein [Gaiellaceae bacterium]|nr:oligosaccharide flippase family protein [Gaiellaceae bacterium]